MHRDDLNDLHAFAAIAAERNFTRAAARLGISQSALSHALRRLETRLGIRLLTRTTRNVALSEAGSRLLARLAPSLENIEDGLRSIGDLRETPSGTIRITASEHSCATVLWPVLKRWLPHYPEVQVEVSLDSRMTDIVGERFDAGVRIGEAVAKDMIAVGSIIVVAAPVYLERSVCRKPPDLPAHRAINLRMRSCGRAVRVGTGEGWSLRSAPGPRGHWSSIVRRWCSRRRWGVSASHASWRMRPRRIWPAATLRQVLTEWTQPFAGYYLYYPSRRQQSAAFALLLEELRQSAAS
jgi:DNA-binding transcriptional LysR family regulator